MPPEKAPKKPRKERKFLTLAEKIDVLTYYNEVKCSARKLAHVFNIGKTQAGIIIRNQENLLKLFEHDNLYNGNCKLRPGSHGYEIDRLVYDWYTEKINENVTLTGPMIKNKALELAQERGHSEFKASNGWLARWLKRHKIGCTSRRNKGKLIIDTFVSGGDLSACHEWEKDMAVLLPKYSADDIFSLVQTGLFYKAVPSDTLYLSGETCSSGNCSEERCTILFCVNMLGMKEKPLVISNFSNTETLIFDESKINCVSDDKAWITKTIFKKWLEEMDYQIGKNHRNIVLFLNHAIPHTDCQLKHIEIVYFPPFFSFEDEPISQKIIQNFKIIYRQLLLRHLIELKDKDGNRTFSNQSITKTQAIEWISTAWAKLSESVVQKGFEDFGFNSFVKNGSEVTADETPASLNDVSNLLCTFDSEVKALDYVIIDNDLVMWDTIEHLEIAVDNDGINHMFMNRVDNMDTEMNSKNESKQDSAIESKKKITFELKGDFVIKSYSDAKQTLKCLEEFYLAQNDSDCAFLVNQLMSYNEQTITDKLKNENQTILPI